MKSIKKAWTLLVVICSLAFFSCSESKTTNTQEEVEIKQMDSTSKAVKETAEKLEDQTKKVEESLEKLDKEFENNN